LAASGEPSDSFANAEKARPPNPIAQDWSIDLRDKGVEKLLQCMTEFSSGKENF
jgi:hypothetical protein